MRASNSCSPMRLLCRGPKVEPAQPTVPATLGLWMVRSSRIRFCSPPEQHRADTWQKNKTDLEQAAASLTLFFIQEKVTELIFSKFYFTHTHLHWSQHGALLKNILTIFTVSGENILPIDLKDEWPYSHISASGHCWSFSSTAVSLWHATLLYCIILQCRAAGWITAKGYQERGNYPGVKLVHLHYVHMPAHSPTHTHPHTCSGSIGSQLA